MVANLMCVLFAAGCSCQNDIISGKSLDGVAFSQFAGHTFNTNQSMFLYQFVSDKQYNLVPPGQEESPGSIQQYYNNEASSWSTSGESGAKVVGVVPKGTRVTIVKLMEDQCDSGAAIPVGRLENGKYKGLLCSMYLMFDRKVLYGRFTWSVKLQYLADEAKEPKR
jgi:hypothetical protein